ncbi:MAG TPA: HAD-IC family P-type ATPase [Thermoanaerobaculia bacterium]|nr:HAD-IC family P-type ATPase [Thermoanaerobaculia bacterium]
MVPNTARQLDDAHALHSEHVMRELEVNRVAGLSDADVLARRAQFGPNVLPHVKRRSLARVFLDQFLNIIVLLLAAAAAISWATGDRLEAVAILIVLLLNALIGFAMEWQAGRALDALRKQTRITARVRRNGVDVPIPAEELVIGDIVLVGAGDRVPADLRILEAAAVRVEESPLTGESKSVFKSTDVVAIDAAIADRSSMLFLGTVVTAGRAVATAVTTGERTELGKIGKLVSMVGDESTPLQKKLNELGRRLAWLVLVIGAVVTLAGWLRGDDLWMMLEIGISLAVAAVPEALPATTTFILAFGVLRMARRNAIVRRLAAVETLGSTTVICSDKTGTLTMNRMTVTEIDARPADLPALLDAIVLCNDATLTSGDPTEIALVAAAADRAIDVEQVRARFPRVAEHPFDAQTKRMITIHRAPDQFYWALKGAPAVVLAACDIDASLRAQITERNTEIAARGLRVLAIAEKRTPLADGDLDHGFRFLGLIGMLDPPRPGVVEAIATARGAGIRLIMLTGDQADTARSIARELHLTEGEPRVTHARELRGADALRIVAVTDVFARVSPEDKYRIVEALQNDGEIVAVTGDGVNDAPALKKSDVGVAMGERGTDVAKEAADIVLADDNFSTIVAAIEGGRAIYANIVKFVHAMFAHNLSEVLTVFVAILLGWPLPLLPLQILWINIVTDVFPAFALALEPPSRHVMERPPRPPGETLLSTRFLVLIVWQGAMLAAIALAAYAYALRLYGPGDHARTIVLLALIAVQLGQMFNSRSRTRSSFEGIFRNPHLWFATATVIGIQIAALQIEALRRLLHLVQPTRSDWMLIALCVALPVAIVETQKAMAQALERHNVKGV